MPELISEIRRAARVSGLGRFRGDVKIEPERGMDGSPRLRLDGITVPRTKKISILNEKLRENFPGLRAGRSLGFKVVVFSEGEANSKDIAEAFDRLYEEKRNEEYKRPWYFPILEFIFRKRSSVA